MAQILIVEDDELLRELLFDTLTDSGHKATATAHGREAQAALLEQNYDLILSDVQMPVMNGIELLQWVRTRSQTPVVLMSGFSRLLELMKPADVGAQGFLTKPFQNEEMLKLIDQILVDQSRLDTTPAQKSRE